MSAFRRRLGIAALLVATLAGASTAQRADPTGLFGLSRDFTQLSEKQTRAVVRVAKRFTGVIVDGRGYVLTEARAVGFNFRDSDRVEVETASGQRYEARPIARSATSRTAIVRIVKGGRYPVIAAGDSDALHVGQLAMTIGNAFNQGGSVQASLTVGHVAGLFPSTDGNTRVTVGRIITTAAVNPGSTGGPLIDVRGMLIGVIDPKRGDGDMGQAMPINFIRESYAENDEAYRVLQFHGGRRSARRYASMIQDTVVEAARAASPAVVSLLVTRRKPVRKKTQEPKKTEARADGDPKKDAPKKDAPKKDDGKKDDGKEGDREKDGDADKPDPEADLPPKAERYDGMWSPRRPRPKKSAKPGAKPQKPRKVNPGLAAQRKRRSGPVSGVVIDADGWIATAAVHLGDDVEKVEVVLADGRVVPASVRGRDRATGLALVKAEATGLPTLARPAQDATPVGAFVVAIGNPYGASRVRSEPFLTFGVLSARGQLDGGRTAVQTDAWINQANQGGALVDLDGRLLGVTVLYNQTRFGLNSGIGFAIPISAIAPILERLQRGDRVECGYVGLRLIPYDEPGLPGVRIETVVEKSPAQLAGLRAGDRLLDVGGTPVRDAAHALYLLAGLREGDRVQIGTSREGDSRLIAIAAGRRR